MCAQQAQTQTNHTRAQRAHRERQLLSVLRLCAQRNSCARIPCVDWPLAVSRLCATTNRRKTTRALVAKIHLLTWMSRDFTSRLQRTPRRSSQHTAQHCLQPSSSRALCFRAVYDGVCGARTRTRAVNSLTFRDVLTGLRARALLCDCFQVGGGSVRARKCTHICVGQMHAWRWCRI